MQEFYSETVGTFFLDSIFYFSSEVLKRGFVQVRFLSNYATYFNEILNIAKTK